MKLLIKASKSNHISNTVNIKFGVKTPCDHKEAMMFDAENGNTNWEDADLLELKQIYNFDPFDSLGPVNSACIPLVHNKIQLHIIYIYKQDGRYKSRMLTSGKMTGPNLDTYYSSVISLCSMRTVVFLYELNNIETCKGDTSNVNLNARTTENILFSAGPEFATFVHAGHFLLIKTALYSLNSSSARFHSRLSDSLTSLGFIPSVGVCDIWMHNE